MASLNQKICMRAGFGTEIVRITKSHHPVGGINNLFFIRGFNFCGDSGGGGSVALGVGRSATKATETKNKEMVELHTLLSPVEVRACFLEILKQVDKLGLKNWVKKCKGGSAWVVVEGNKASIEKFSKWCDKLIAKSKTKVKSKATVKNSKGKIRVSIHVFGKVQDVFYRSSTETQAKKLKLTGEVWNCEDGSVKIIAEGKPESIEKLVKWCRRGPPDAKVKRLTVRYSKFKGEFKGFEY